MFEKHFDQIIILVRDISAAAQVLVRSRALEKSWSEDVRSFARDARAPEEVESAIAKADHISRARSKRFVVGGYWNSKATGED